MMKGALLLLLALARSLPAQEAPPAVAAQLYTAVRPETVTVGEPFRSVVRLTVAPGARAAYPPMPVRDEIQPIDSVRVLPSDADATTATAVYTLVAWTTEPFVATIPVRVTVPGGEPRVYNVPLRLPEVRSVLPAGEEDVEPRPARGVVAPAPAGVPAWVWWAMALAAALLAVYLARRLRRNAPLVEADPRARALARLEALGVAGLDSAATRRGLYVEASGALREYLAALSPGWGTDLTTTELLERMEGDSLGPGARDAMGLLLRAADRVKFAGDLPDAAVAGRFRQAARRWVERFPPPVAPRAEAA